MSYDFSHLHRFPGGLRLASHKDLSTTRPIARLPLPRRLTLPLSQHIGFPPCHWSRPASGSTRGR
jgi:Na+-translocating ferredoxin:NAD+ oxidoreductase RnfC subunit